MQKTLQSLRRSTQEDSLGVCWACSSALAPEQRREPGHWCEVEWAAQWTAQVLGAAKRAEEMVQHC